MLELTTERYDERAPGQVRALARALSILRELGREAGGLTLTELSHRVGLAPSTTHRLLTTLETQRFVRLAASDSRWRVGVEAFATGAAFARSRDLVEIARPALEGLRDRTGETAMLFIADLGEIVCMAQAESLQPMRVTVPVGGRTPMHVAAAGKAILAFMREDAALRMIRGARLKPLTERTVTEPEALIRELRETRLRGVALELEEQAVGLFAAASPVFDEAGAVAAAMAVAGPTARLDAARRREAAAEALAAARLATAEFGGRFPPIG